MHIYAECDWKIVIHFVNKVPGIFSAPCAWLPAMQVFNLNAMNLQWIGN